VFPPIGLVDNQLDKIQREFLAHCQLIQPPYFPVLSIEEVEGRMLIVLWAPGGQNRPYKAPESVTAKHKVWRYYIRRYSSTVQAKGDTEQELLSLAAKGAHQQRRTGHPELPRSGSVDPAGGLPGGACGQPPLPQPAYQVNS
jgi:hypothetical protein